MAPRSSSIGKWLPLKPVQLHVLLALAEGDSHAYGIIQSVKARSAGRIKLETGPLYRHLMKLTDGGLVGNAAERPTDDDPRRGTYYTLTPLGKDVLAAESERLEEVVSLVKELGLERGGGSV